MATIMQKIQALPSNIITIFLQGKFVGHWGAIGILAIVCLCIVSIQTALLFPREIDVTRECFVEGFSGSDPRVIIDCGDKGKLQGGVNSIMLSKWAESVRSGTALPLTCTFYKDQMMRPGRNFECGVE